VVPFPHPTQIPTSSNADRNENKSSLDLTRPPFGEIHWHSLSVLTEACFRAIGTFELAQSCAFEIRLDLLYQLNAK
jgi:hypothetical protein